MRVVRTVLVAVIALLFSAVSVFWVGYIPKRPAAIYSSIPAEADMLTVHWDLASRIEELMDNRIFTSIAAATGLTDEQVAQMTADPDARRWLDRIASQECVVAHLPARAFAGGSSWCMAAWVGSESLRLRWSIALSAPKESNLGSVAGTHVWRFDLPDLPRGQHLYCAVEEGVFLAALSDSPDAIHQMVLAYQGRVPSLLSAYPDWQMPGRSLSVYPDQFSYFTGGGMQSSSFQLRLSNISRGILAGIGGGSIPESAVLTDVPPIVDWPSPMLQASLSPELVRALALRFSDNHPFLPTALALSKQLQSGPLFIGLLGDENRGRLKGFRIPGLLLAMPVKDEQQALETMLSKLDRLNAVYSLGLIHHRVQIADTAVYYVEGTRDNFYGGIPPNEQVAFMVRNGFLLLGSHSGLLEKIAADHLLEGDSPVWSELRRPRPHNYVWIDFERAAKSLHLALALYSIQLIGENPGEARVIRERINLIRDWVDACVPYRTAKIWSAGEQSPALFRFQMGAD